MNHAIREGERERERKEKRNERKRKRERKRNREREKEEEEEKEEREEEEKEKGKKKEQAAFVKGFSFFSWLQDQLWKSLLQLWTLSTNLLKWIGPSHGPVPWKFVEKLFFNKGLIIGQILLGKVWALNLAIAFVKGLSFFSWIQDQLWKSLLQLWPLSTNLLKWIGPSHGPVPWKFVEKLFFNEGLVSGLILLGKVWALNLAIAFVKGFSFFSWLQDQLWKSLLHLRILRTNLLKWIGPSHGPVPWKFVIWFFWERFGLWTWQLLL